MISDQNIEVIERRFFEGEPMPYWDMYKDQSKKHKIGSNVDISDLDESFDKMIQMAEDTKLMYQNIKQVYISIRPTVQKNPTNCRQLAIPFTRDRVRMNGYNSFGEAKYTEAYLNRAVNDAVDQANKERDLRDSIKSLEEKIERGLDESPLYKAVKIINENEQMAAMFAPLIAGVINKFVMPSINGTTVSVSGIQETVQKSQSDINTDLERIQKVFPDIQVFIHSLANYVSGNPKQAKMIFNQITGSSESEKSE